MPSNINIDPDPMVGRRGVSLASQIFGEEYVTGQECFMRAVTHSDVDTPGEGDDPASMWRAVIVNDMGGEIVSEQQSRGWPRGVEKL